VQGLLDQQVREELAADLLLVVRNPGCHVQVPADAAAQSGHELGGFEWVVLAREPRAVDSWLTTMGTVAPSWPVSSYTLSVRFIGSVVSSAMTSMRSSSASRRARAQKHR
jgi:hypothetical protein